MGKNTNEAHSKKFEIFGENMRLARKKMGLTGKVFADFVGVTVSYVGLIERGERHPSLPALFRICDFVGKSVDEMFTDPAANKNAKAPKDKTTTKRETINSLISTFDEKRLDYIIRNLKSLNTLGDVN